MTIGAVFALFLSPVALLASMLCPGSIMESVTVGASLNEVVPDEFLVPHTTSAKVLTDTLQVPTGIKHPTSRLVEKSQETGLFCFSPPESIIHEVNGSFIQKCLSLPTVSLLRLHQESYSPGSDESLWLLPVNSGVICNYSIPAGEAVSNITQLPCDEEPCVHWVKHRSVYLDLSETVVAGPTKDEGEDFRYAGRIEMVTDHNGNIIYQWYDHKGHLHSLSEQEYKLRLALYFQSVLEVLYPEYFGAVLPAGGGWHRWDSIGKWKVRQVPYNKTSNQKKGGERNSKRRRSDSDLGGFHREGDNRKQQKIIHIDDQLQLRPRKKISVEDFFSKKVAKVDECQEIADQLFKQCKRGGKLQEAGRLMVLSAAGHLSQNHSFIWVAPVDAIAKMAFSLVKMKSDDLDSQKLITLAVGKLAARFLDLRQSEINHLSDSQIHWFAKAFSETLERNQDYYSEVVRAINRLAGLVIYSENAPNKAAFWLAKCFVAAGGGKHKEAQYEKAQYEKALEIIQKKHGAHFLNQIYPKVSTADIPAQAERVPALENNEETVTRCPDGRPVLPPPASPHQSGFLLSKRLDSRLRVRLAYAWCQELAHSAMRLEKVLGRMEPDKESALLFFNLPPKNSSAVDRQAHHLALLLEYFVQQNPDSGNSANYLHEKLLQEKSFLTASKLVAVCASEFRLAYKTESKEVLMPLETLEADETLQETLQTLQNPLMLGLYFGYSSGDIEQLYRKIAENNPKMTQQEHMGEVAVSIVWAQIKLCMEREQSKKCEPLIRDFWPQLITGIISSGNDAIISELEQKWPELSRNLSEVECTAQHGCPDLNALNALSFVLPVLPFLFTDEALLKIAQLLGIPVKKGERLEFDPLTGKISVLSRQKKAVLANKIITQIYQGDHCRTMGVSPAEALIIMAIKAGEKSEAQYLISLFQHSGSDDDVFFRLSASAELKQSLPVAGSLTGSFNACSFNPCLVECVSDAEFMEALVFFFNHDRFPYEEQLHDCKNPGWMYRQCCKKLFEFVQQNTRQAKQLPKEINGFIPFMRQLQQRLPGFRCQNLLDCFKYLAEGQLLTTSPITEDSALQTRKAQYELLKAILDNASTKLRQANEAIPFKKIAEQATVMSSLIYDWSRLPVLDTFQLKLAISDYMTALAVQCLNRQIRYIGVKQLINVLSAMGFFHYNGYSFSPSEVDQATINTFFHSLEEAEFFKQCYWLQSLMLPEFITPEQSSKRVFLKDILLPLPMTLKTALTLKIMSGIPTPSSCSANLIIKFLWAIINLRDSDLNLLPVASLVALPVIEERLQTQALWSSNRFFDDSGEHTYFPKKLTQDLIIVLAEMNDNVPAHDIKFIFDHIKRDNLLTGIGRSRQEVLTKALNTWRKRKDSQSIHSSIDEMLINIKSE